MTEQSTDYPTRAAAGSVSDRARVGSAAFIIVLLVCFVRSPRVSSATVLSGPKDSPTVAALKQSGRYESLRSAFREAQHQVEPQGTAFRLEVTDRGVLYPVTVDPWIQQQELTAADGVRDDVFGYSVAVSETTAVIGAAGKTLGNKSGQGAAYVFTCSGIPCTWTQQQELTASDGASRDEFGNRVGVSGNTVIIGNNSKQGAAYVFTCSGTPCTWKVRRWWPFRTRKQQQQELTASDGRRGDEFGYSVAVSGNTAIIGAAYKNSYQGAAYVFSPAVAITGRPMRPPP